MTAPKSIKDMQRRNRRFGDMLRTVVACPLCGPDLGSIQHMGTTTVRVIAYRNNSFRLACLLCGLRFSLDPGTLFAALNRRGDDGRLTFTGGMAAAVFGKDEDWHDGRNSPGRRPGRPRKRTPEQEQEYAALVATWKAAEQELSS